MVLSKPVVTVLMPFYNGEKYLKESIESVLNQTFQDFELLIIDDCSTDSSENIINSYKDERIRYLVNKKNIGQSGTMNRGIKLAKGEYIARLDQDDVSNKDRLQVQLDKITGLNKTIVGSWSYAIDNLSKIIGYIHHPLDSDSIIDALAINTALTHSSVFMKKTDLLSLRGYSLKYKIAMDWDLWIRAANNSFTFINIPEYLIGIRQHDKQASMEKKGKMDLNKETLSLISFSKDIIKTKKNYKAQIGWKYYHETMFIFYNNKLFKSLYKFIYSFLKFQSLCEFLKIFVFHKVINNPKILYNVPSHFTKNPSKK